MSEQFAREQHIRYNKGRAAAINELELIKVPSYFAVDLQPYIHFLIVEKKPRQALPYLSLDDVVCRTTVKKEGSLATNSDSRDLEHKMKDVSEKLDV